MLGNRVAPGPLDRYLARTGCESQQTGHPADRDHSHCWPGWGVGAAVRLVVIIVTTF